MPVHLELAPLRHALADGEVPPMLRALVGSNLPDSTRAADSRPASNPPPESDRLAVLLDIVRGEAATVLGLPGPDGVPVDRALRSLGMDSLTMVELRKRLSKRMNTKLPATLVFDYPTAEAIAGLLLSTGGELS